MTPAGGEDKQNLSPGQDPAGARAFQRQIDALEAQQTEVERLRLIQAELDLALHDLTMQNRQLVNGLPDIADRLGLPHALCSAALILMDCNAAASLRCGLQNDQNLGQILPPPEATALRKALRRSPGEARPEPLILTLPGPERRCRAELVPLAQDGGFHLLLMPLPPLDPATREAILVQCMDDCPDAMSAHDLRGQQLYANRKASLAQAMTLHETLQHQDLTRHVLEGSSRVTRMIDRNPQEQVVVTKFPLYDPAGILMAVATRVHDATRELQQHADLQFASLVLEQSLDAILVTDAMLRIRTVNPAFQGLTGFGGPMIRGRALETVLTRQSSLSSWGNLRADLRDTGQWQGEMSLRTAAGTEVSVWCSASRLADETGKVIGHVFIQSDLTRLRQIQRENESLARFDTLTGLPNRKLMQDRLNEILREAELADESFAVLFIDLDSFKSVNDTLGHATGDGVLVTVARRLASALRVEGTVGRIGGDEFVVLLPSCDESKALVVARALLEACALPVALEGMADYRPTASVGIALYPDHGLTGDALLRSADTAMYAAKAARSQVAVFRPAMLKAAATLLDVRNALTGALERNEFELHYQPIFRLGDGGITGAEALLRWQRPGHGLLMPDAFLETAEVAGLMRAIDAWVLRQAVCDLGRWRAAGLVAAGWRMSVNQTADDLSQPSWVTGLVAALEMAGIAGPDPGLQIELTESHMAGTRETIQTSLREMERLGVRLAVDDFGTGYSNLAYLRRLPISMLKIDKGFVTGLEDDPNAQVLARAMIGLGQQFGYEILAEGIETEGQRNVLSAMGCKLGQGYLVARPLPAAGLTQLLAQRPGGPP